MWSKYGRSKPLGERNGSNISWLKLSRCISNRSLFCWFYVSCFRLQWFWAPCLLARSETSQLSDDTTWDHCQSRPPCRLEGIFWSFSAHLVHVIFLEISDCFPNKSIGGGPGTGRRISLPWHWLTPTDSLAIAKAAITKKWFWSWCIPGHYHVLCLLARAEAS